MRQHSGSPYPGHSDSSMESRKHRDALLLLLLLLLSIRSSLLTATSRTVRAQDFHASALRCSSVVFSFSFCHIRV